jgi:hypothetical protein
MAAMVYRYFSAPLLALLLLTSDALLSTAALAQATDPMVQLDSAKMTLADGKLSDAQEQFAAITTAGAEDYVVEEVVFQRMILSAAFLNATQFLLDELGRHKRGESTYAAWLAGQRDAHSADYQANVQQFLALTAGGMSLEFVRFRLPKVSEAHLQDVILYSDPEVLAAATTNWDEGREGLGKGLIMAQARVAVTLAAAQYYDLPLASASIAGVSRRLSAGVPLEPEIVLDWVADTSLRLAPGSPPLKALSQEADRRLAALIAGHPGSGWDKRIELRRNGPPKAVAAAPKEETKPPAAPKKKKSKNRKRR